LVALRFPDVDDTRRHRERALEQVLGARFLGGNDVRVLKNGVEIFPAMLAAIEAAETSIAFVTFVYWQGEIAERFANALADAARRGVDVMVVLDAVGASDMSDALVALLEDAGADVRWFRPKATWRVWRTSHRTHRKLLIVDHDVGFTGGVGIAEEWTGDARSPDEWRDTHLEIRGPAVRNLWGAFAGNWIEMTADLPARWDDARPCDPIPGSDERVLIVRSTASIGWSETASMFRTLLALAKRRVWAATPYFVPDDKTVEQLCRLAMDGADVRILLPGEHIDQTAVRLASERTMGALLEAGVRIHEYDPTMMHAKVLIVDDDLACVGSANMNQRSLRKDDEVSAVLSSPRLVELLGDHFMADLDRSTERSLQGWREAWWRRALGALLAPFRTEM
jgi:cardiolipin synthase